MFSGEGVAPGSLPEAQEQATLTVASQMPPQLHRHEVQCLGPSMLRVTTTFCVPNSWGKPWRQDPAQTRPFVVGIPHEK